MARKKTPPRRGALATLVSLGLAIPREATRRTAAGLRDTLTGQVEGSIDIVERMAQRYGLPRKQIAQLLADTLQNVTSPAEAIRAVQDLATKLPGGALKRAQGATATSLGILSEVAGRVGLPMDVMMATLLSAVGKDWDQLAKRQREKIRKALAVVEEWRVQTEDAEEALIEILGPEYPISWELLTAGPATLRDELNREFHALKVRPGAPQPTPGAGESPGPARAARAPGPSVRPKPAAAESPEGGRPTASAKPKPKAKAKPKPKPKPKAKAKAAAKPKAKAKPAPAKRKAAAKKRPS